MCDSCTVVAEELLDAVLLNRVIQRALSIDARFFTGDGQIALTSLARNILVHDGGPVLVVMDAETTNGDMAAEACAMTRMALGHVSPDDAFDVCALVPQLEVVFFEAPGVLRRHLGAHVHDLELELGRFSPAQTLNTLLARSGRDLEFFVRELDDCDLDALLAGPQLSRFISSADTLFSSTAGAPGR
jgi:hypothetical protein